jgi:hypothetical protein
MGLVGGSLPGVARRQGKLQTRPWTDPGPLPGKPGEPKSRPCIFQRSGVRTLNYDILIRKFNGQDVEALEEDPLLFFVQEREDRIIFLRSQRQ